MDKLILDFIAILARQRRLLDNLVELGEEKRSVIILGEIEKLDKLMQKEGIIVSNLEKLEGARFKLQNELARGWEMSARELTADIIQNKVKEYFPANAYELQDGIKQVRQVIAHIKSINSENSELLNMSLDYIGELQAMLTGDVAGTYSNQGQQVDETTSRPRLRILDKKA